MGKNIHPALLARKKEKEKAIKKSKSRYVSIKNAKFLEDPIELSNRIKALEAKSKSVGLTSGEKSLIKKFSQQYDVLAKSEMEKDVENAELRKRAIEESNRLQQTSYDPLLLAFDPLISKPKQTLKQSDDVGSTIMLSTGPKKLSTVQIQVQSNLIPRSIKVKTVDKASLPHQYPGITPQKQANVFSSAPGPKIRKLNVEPVKKDEDEELSLFLSEVEQLK